MSNIIDFNQVKIRIQEENEQFTYREYIDDLQVVREQFHLLPLEHQHQVFQETSHLLIELISTCIKEGKCE